MREKGWINRKRQGTPGDDPSQVNLWAGGDLAGKRGSNGPRSKKIFTEKSQYKYIKKDNKVLSEVNKKLSLRRFARTGTAGHPRRGLGTEIQKRCKRRENCLNRKISVSKHPKTGEERGKKSVLGKAFPELEENTQWPNPKKVRRRLVKRRERRHSGWAWGGWGGEKAPEPMKTRGRRGGLVGVSMTRGLKTSLIIRDIKRKNEN